jgi:hypothetical protein
MILRRFRGEISFLTAVKKGLNWFEDGLHSMRYVEQILLKKVLSSG